MSITNSDIQKALRIKRVINEYFEKSTEKRVQAKELMKHFIKADIFTKNHQDGLPIRDFLRHLEENGSLKLIPQAYFEQKSQNKNWYFLRGK